MTSRKLGLALVAILALAACSGDENAVDQVGNLRVAQFSPNAPVLDVDFNDNQVVAGLGYAQVSSYQVVEAGTYTLDFEPTASTAALLSTTLDVGEGDELTVLAINYVDEIEALVLVDDDVAPPAGQARARVVHAAPDAPAVDLYITPIGAPLEDPVLADVSFGEASAYVNLPAGLVQVSVTLAGTDVVVASGRAEAFSGLVTTLVVSEEPGDPSDLSLNVLIDDRF